jgi:hypothetical protein
MPGRGPLVEATGHANGQRPFVLENPPSRVMHHSEVVGRAVPCPPHDGSATFILPRPDGGPAV